MELADNFDGEICGYATEAHGFCAVPLLLFCFFFC